MQVIFYPDRFAEFYLSLIAKKNFMRTIIAPTDFSAVSLNAVNYAADLAVAINAELILLHVVQIPITVSEIPFTLFEYEEIMEDPKRELAILVNQLFIRTKEKINIHHQVMIGSVSGQLKNICERRKPFAIVMGTRGAGAVDRFFFGSNTMYAVNNSQYPVLVVPQNASFNGIKKIAVASDLKEIKSIKPIEILKCYLEIFTCKLDVIHVIDRDLDPEAVTASVSLENLLPEFSPQFHFVSKENVEKGIYQLVEENHPDLLIVFPKEHGLFGSVFHKSISKHLILHPHIPVLAIAE